MTGVPAHTIRFWEKDFGMYLNPWRTKGGQRRYSTRDVEVIEKIRHLRYEKLYTIAGTVCQLKRDFESLRLRCDHVPGQQKGDYETGEP